MKIEKYKTTTDTSLTVQQYKIRAVDTFKYLGITVGKTGKESLEKKILMVFINLLA